MPNHTDYSNGKLSTIERLHLADEERQRHKGGGSVAGFVGNGPRPITPERQREIDARAVPAALFASDAELVRLKTEHERFARILKNFSWRAMPRPTTLESSNARSLQWAVMEDTINGDADYPRARALAMRQLVQERITAAYEDVLESFSKPWGGALFGQDCEEALRAYEARLFTLQLAHVDDMATRAIRGNGASEGESAAAGAERPASP